jgi:hypothetical protein
VGDTGQGIGGGGVTGEELLGKIVDLAHWTGWSVAHFRSVRVQRADGSTYYQTPVAADGKGWPDLVMVHPQRGLILYREIKGNNETVSKDQAEWGARLSIAGGDWNVWRPRHWVEIEATLKGDA